jgi:hypothetical protein
MSSQLVFWVGNQNPSITETVLNDDGSAHDLTGQTVRFRMRAVGSAVLKVDAAATVVSSPAGTVRYDWQAADVDTAGQYLVWWQVTTTAGGKTQDMAEALIEFRVHSNAAVYLELEQFKSTLELTGTTFADQDLEQTAQAASRAVDQACNRRFWLDTGTANIRYYTPRALRFMPIDDLVTLTSVAIDRSGTGTYTETWTSGSDFVLEPFNAPSAVPPSPFENLRVRALSGRWLPTYIEKSVQVTGQFGWSSVPDDVQTATLILAAKLFRRSREAPFGIVTVGIDEGAAMRIARTDPDVHVLLAPYSRHVPLI